MVSVSLYLECLGRKNFCIVGGVFPVTRDFQEDPGPPHSRGVGEASQTLESKVYKVSFENLSKSSVSGIMTFLQHKIQNILERKSIGRTDPKKYRQSTRKKPDNWRRDLSKSWIYGAGKDFGRQLSCS